MQTLNAVSRRSAKAPATGSDSALLGVFSYAIVVTSAMLLTTIALTKEGIFPSSPTQALSSLGVTWTTPNR